ncbi:MAG: hypothetical protein BAJALOKI2v1_340023 [Promethearchaeota archaeon]|nr:MAG: hypothetical protein BAJALOKI2v1_340023 [Candidatus Lokiarchaeota archaeon]
MNLTGIIQKSKFFDFIESELGEVLLNSSKMVLFQIKKGKISQN